MSVALNKAIPDFSFNATSDTHKKLSDLRGKHVVIYFYPKDNTPGCTSESKDFTAKAAEFAQANAVILGVSKDSLASHEKFKAKYNMPFELISDPDEDICRLFDIIQLKNFMGKKYMGIVRSTFVIDANGILRQEWRKVKVNGHVDAVLDYVKRL